MFSGYRARFYRRRHANTVPSARLVLDALLCVLPPVRSVLDVGCGVGSWLSAFRERGIDDVLGLDGDWVPRDMLRIPTGAFRPADLAAPPQLGRRFDLAMSLEVAEHIPAVHAGRFVRMLTDSSDIVLFGAAIPGQGGVGHVNEQWPAHWAEVFRARGYRALDVLRPLIWGVAEIPYWYKQNTVLYVAEEAIAADSRLHALAEGAPDGPPLGMVHPEAFARARLGTLRWYLGQWQRRLRGQDDALTV